MLNYEDLADLLGTPVDLEQHLRDLSDGELRFLGERALTYAGMRSPGIRGFGDALRLAVRREHARRTRDAAVMRTQFDEIVWNPADSGDLTGDVSGLPRWSEISSSSELEI